MAFNMKRPMIKGTPVHKASIAKAKAQSIVAQTRTQADSALVGAAQSMGKSYVPAAIDYTISSKQEYKSSGNETKKGGNKSKSNKETEKVEVLDPKDYPGSTLEGMSKQAVEGTGPETEAGRGYVQPANKNPRVMTEEEFKAMGKEKNLRITKEESEKVISGNDKTVEELQKKEFERLQKERERKKQEKIDQKKEEEERKRQEKIDQKEYENNEILEKDDPDIGDMDYDGNNNGIPDNQEQKKTTVKETPPSERTREQKEDDKIYNDFRTSKYKKKKMIEGGYTPIEGKSPVEMRDDRIYRNALSDGPIRKNMIKGGYTPK